MAGRPEETREESQPSARRVNPFDATLFRSERKSAGLFRERAQPPVSPAEQIGGFSANQLPAACRCPKRV